jgi:hypothetical protein
MPVRFAKGPVGRGIVTPKALNEFLLKPSTISQKAFGHFPPLVLITSRTSSLPNVSLFAQNETRPSGNGLSVTGPGMLAVADDG